MRVQSILFLIFFAISHNISTAQGLNDVTSNSGSNVWAVGDNGLVMYSVEGGNYWTRVYIGSNNYNAVFIRGNTYFIAGDNGELLRSSNGGNSFVTIPTGTTSNLNSIYFYDNLTGWISGDNGIILRTTNAGLNWVTKNSGTVQDLNQIKFTNLTKGSACGNNGTVLLTIDSGNTWTTAIVPVVNNLLSIDIFGNAIFSSGVESAFIKSTNSGSTWSSVNYNIETKSDITSLQMLNELLYYSAGGGGFIRYSTNGGQSFTFRSNPLFADIQKIYFLGQRGWAVSRSTNAVIRTTDGGSRWLLPAGVSQSFSWELKIPLIFYTSSGNVFAYNPNNRNEIFVTKANTIYRTLNRGDNWTQIASISALPVNSTSNAFLISPKDTNVFLVAIDSSLTDAGKVMRSTNYGQNWTTVFSGNRNPDGCPLEMDPNHPDTVYYAPSDSFLFRSTNFGLTWNQVGTKRFSDICIVEVLEDSSNIILTGDASAHGTLYRSSDYGQIWTNVNDTLCFEIPDIANSKLSPSYVYTTFFEGVGGLKRSTNYGKDWINININYEAWAVDIARDDPTTFAYGTWFNNPIYLTNDGGVSFTQTAIIPGGTFALYFYNRTTLFAQMSEGFYKMRVNYMVPIGINQISALVPDKFLLEQNYPNPFNPFTVIRYSIPSNVKSQTSNVKLVVYNTIGEEITKLVNENQNPGTYEVDFNAAGLSSGIYFYKLEAGDFVETKRMVLLK